MNVHKFKLVYGEYSGLEKKAIDLVSRELSEYLNYVMPAKKASDIADDELKNCNLIIIGLQSNPILKKLAEKGLYKNAECKEGYSLKVTKSAFDDNAQMVIISGYDEAGVLYGAVDFAAYYIPFAENTHDHGHYFRNIFDGEALPEYESISSPSVSQRGIWSWGHVIYDYKKYIQNMVRLKMNTLIVWNDFLPLNIKEVINEAHEHGIKIYLGFSWGWNEARSQNGGLDISDDTALRKISDIILAKYDHEYSKLDIDGIYFQSFTETNVETNHNIVIAERVVKMVNEIAEELFVRKPDLSLMFGLHASSVAQKLEYIKKTDERIMIVWEDCGAFPYAYSPYKIEGFKETCELSEKIAVLRGENDSFGIVSKGLVCLDWSTFEHQTGEFVMGQQSDAFIKKRTEEKSKLWNYVNAYWMKNAG